MLKPKNYDNTPVMGDWKPLAPGGYVCEIMSVEEEISKGGYEMLRVCFEIAEGEEKERFTKEWKTSTQKVKYWGGVSFVFVYDSETKETSKAFKTFISAIEKTNKITINWVPDADQFAAQFKNMLVGIVFGREEYMKSDNKTTAWKTSARYFRSVDIIRENKFNIPDDKPLDSSKVRKNTKPEDIGFEELAPDDDLPFDF